jgi:hypothetical protein
MVFKLGQTFGARVANRCRAAAIVSRRQPDKSWLIVLDNPLSPM